MGSPDKTSREDEISFSEWEWEEKGGLWEGKGKRGRFWEGGKREKGRWKREVKGEKGKEVGRREEQVEAKPKGLGWMVNRMWMDCR